ncbi:hypothetical protein ACKUVQ_14345 [Mycobacterium seoulense]|uniref:hypothetical protein n=2 Tax=Mycobacterium TaxID=1763 RepID=UPI0013D1E6BE|nr:hypothetical protein [Mycobacterium seoulense]MCV7437517.1 hypothetical protein [Mycobacterium seoulense]
MAGGTKDSGHEDASERIEMIEAAPAFAFVCMSDDFHPGGPTAVSNRIGALNFGVEDAAMPPRWSKSKLGDGDVLQVVQLLSLCRRIAQNPAPAA